MDTWKQRLSVFEAEAEKRIDALAGAAIEEMEELGRKLKYSELAKEAEALGRKLKQSELAKEAEEIRRRAEMRGTEWMRRFEKQKAKAFDRLGVVTREQLEDLSAQVEDLSRRLERLAKKAGKAASERRRAERTQA